MTAQDLDYMVNTIEISHPRSLNPCQIIKDVGGLALC